MTEDTDYDFGFSIISDDELPLKEDQTRLIQLRDMIMPLLINLKKNPEKDLISWPGDNRIRSIDNFIKKMNTLIDNRHTTIYDIKYIQ